MDPKLKGNRVLITGGSRGIGLATALGFAREGARVAICARNAEQLEAAAASIRQETGAEVLSIAADVTDPVNVVSLINTVAERFGGLDSLVNNAGTATPGALDKLTDADWLADWDASLGSMVRTCRAALPHFRQSGGGAIVNVTALVGREPKSGILVGSSHRAACTAFTKGLANELGPENIRVNSVGIGVVWNDMRERAWRNSGRSKEEFLAPVVEAIPLGRVGQPEEVAAAILFLVSSQASYITGSSIDLGGGIGRSAF
jgi:3-oxoacyl-[acyl-carrier protein] reductase